MSENIELSEDEKKGVEIVFKAFQKNNPEILDLVSFHLSSNEAVIFMDFFVDIHMIHKKYFNRGISKYWEKNLKNKKRDSTSLVSYFNEPTEEEIHTSINVRKLYENRLNQLYDLLPENFKHEYPSTFIDGSKITTTLVPSNFEFFI